jgi:hypothetical protein
LKKIFDDDGLSQRSIATKNLEICAAFADFFTVDG